MIGLRDAPRELDAERTAAPRTALRSDLVIYSWLLLIRVLLPRRARIAEVSASTTPATTSLVVRRFRSVARPQLRRNRRLPGYLVAVAPPDGP